MISYALSMIPPWREALAHALDVVAPGGSLHIVDFGDCAGLPGPFKAALRRWLAMFDVTPRDDLATRSRRSPQARHDMRDREPVSRLRDPGGRALRTRKRVRANCDLDKKSTILDDPPGDRFSERPPAAFHGENGWRRGMKERIRQRTVVEARRPSTGGLIRQTRATA